MSKNTDNVIPIRRGHGSGSNGGNGNHGERLARIEAILEHKASKEDLQKIKVWVLSGILGGMFSAAALAAFIVKSFGAS